MKDNLCPQCAVKDVEYKQLRSVLEFYADRKHYEIDPEIDVRLIDLDKGDRARDMLNE